ncbi:LamG domain-containing protein [Flavobacterium defluvii]|uniref:Concanavalin A-like lectin/glucanases superfamily protein n=1 Tax=Flavobacterium defluvii TaxID=370979 RepID=A0A1M5HWB6_9FLAO|nr:LamG domain-containing protein [Flavobacterium defluvii]SHG20230.1 Concanavalin A-like lectin/glucanases superfamily protein [Flavobacterium defluvii]
MKKFLLSVMFVSYLNATAQNPIQEFNFNGTLNNESNTTSFMGTNNFVADRSGVAGNAQRLNNKALEAVIDNLPQGSSARTVSIWIKFNDIASANYIWGYGSVYNAQYFGLLQQATVSSNSDLSLAGWGPANDLIVSTSLSKGVWYQYTVTFDGTVSKMYRNGELLKYISGLKRSTKGTIFRLGEINTSVGINADIDDLKIYDVALTDEQVAESYNNSKPLITVTETATKTKNTIAVRSKTSTKAATSANIIENKDVIAGSKNIEVYSQGLKVVGDNTMSINDLPEGTYLLKITSAPAKKITSK